MLFTVNEKVTKPPAVIVIIRCSDVSTGATGATAGATGATAVAPKFSDTLTLSQPGGTDSAHHCRGRT